MILLLDNYDSFTYNLVQYLAELGAEVRVERNDAVTIEQIVRLQPAGIVLSPGPGRPENAGIMISLIEAFSPTCPILGVCLGHQAIGMVFGAELTYAPTLMHGKTSPIFHNGSGLFAGIPTPFTATRYHSLMLKPSTVIGPLRISARTDDNLVMAIEHERLPVCGVQFHPESFMTGHGKAILANFLDRLQ